MKLNKGGDEEASVDEEVADPGQFAGDVVDQLDPSLFRQEEEEEEEEEIPLDEAEDQIDVSDLPQEFQDDLEKPVERLPDGTAKWGDLYNFYLDNDDMVGTQMIRTTDIPWPLQRRCTTTLATIRRAQ